MQKRRMAVVIYVCVAALSLYVVIKQPWRNGRIPQDFSPAWLAPFGDAQNTGRGQESRAKGQLAWTHKLDFHLSVSEPLVDANNTLYAVAGDIDIDFETAYRVYAIDTRNGRERWHINAGGFFSLPYLSSRCVAGRDRHLYVFLLDGDVYAVDTRNGSFFWQTKIAKYPVTPLVDEKGTLYVGGDDGSMVAIEPTEERILWKNSLSGDVHVAAISPDGTLLYVSAGQTLYALDSRSGNQVWVRPLNGPDPVIPIVSKTGTVFVNRPALSALNGTTGEDMAIVPGQVPAQSRIVMIDSHDVAYAFDAAKNRMYAFESGHRTEPPLFPHRRQGIDRFCGQRQWHDLLWNRRLPPLCRQKRGWQAVVEALARAALSKNAFHWAEPARSM